MVRVEGVVGESVGNEKPIRQSLLDFPSRHRCQDQLFLIRLVALLVDLRVDVAGPGTSTFGNVAADVKKLTAFFTGRALFGWGRHINGIAALVALKNSHLLAPFRNSGSHKNCAMSSIPHTCRHSKQYNVRHVKNQLAKRTCPLDRHSRIPIAGRMGIGINSNRKGNSLTTNHRSAGSADGNRAHAAPSGHHGSPAPQCGHDP
jgi:hypothetical protein